MRQLYGFGPNAWRNNYGLQTNSPCIGAGTNPSALNLPGLGADLTGKARPASGPWDIGAYQH
jgi:hypothetical protein